MKIEVNGIELFYEKEGNGPPLILLHGNGESSSIFCEAAKELAKNWTVYRPDSRGHGRSSRVPELHYQDMADDMAAFIRKLELGRPVFYGFSDGGIIGLLIAAGEPDLLSGLMISGANLQPRGLKPFIYWFFKILNLIYFKPAYELMLTEPNIRKSDLKKIRIPVYVTAGHRDLIRESHTRFLAEHIPESKLDILAGESHGSYVVNSLKLVKIIEEGAVFFESKWENTGV